MRIFITGGSGLLGQYLNMVLSKEHEILTQYNTKQGNCFQYSCVQTDITDYKKIEALLMEFKPNIIIHTAAVTSIQATEKIPSKLIFETNVNATAKLAELSSTLNSKLFYTSTDLVYAGYRGSMLKEDAKLMPASLYAETKLMGEEKIKAASHDYIILRTGLLYGFGLYGSTCYFNYMFQNLKNRIPVKLFYDQFRTPLSLWEAAKIISELCRLNINNEIINFGGKMRLSRLELGEQLCKIPPFHTLFVLRRLAFPTCGRVPIGTPPARPASSAEHRCLGCAQHTAVEYYSTTLNSVCNASTAA